MVGPVCPTPLPDNSTLPQSLEQRVIHRAADLVGGYDELSRLLGVGDGRVALWMAGTERPPQPLFLDAVDILVSYGTRQDARRLLNEHFALARRSQRLRVTPLL
jgi:hypothetical protein